MILALFLGVLIGSILLGLPVAFALLLSALALMVHLDTFSVDILGAVAGQRDRQLSAAGDPVLPGGRRGDGVGRAVQAYRPAGHEPAGPPQGRAGYVAIFTSVLLAGLSGSAVADAAALVSILYPMMKQSGYPEGRSLGLLAAGGIIAPVIPPSLPLIVLGVADNISIAKLFIGGIVPGLMMGVALMITWSLVTRNETLAVTPRATGAERLAALRDGVWALIMPILIMGGIRSRIVTPTEAAVVAAVYAIAVSMLVYREMTWRMLVDTLISAGRSTAMVMFLVGAAMVAAWLITVAQLPQQLAEALAPLVDRPRLLMLLLSVIKMAGIDPVYFGLMFIINSCIGLITPPVGSVLNVVCGVGKAPMSKVVRGTLPFVTAYLILLGLFILFPALITVPLNILTG